jgi:uncharacterized membrane protein
MRASALAELGLALALWASVGAALVLFGQFVALGDALFEYSTKNKITGPERNLMGGTALAGALLLTAVWGAYVGTLRTPRALERCGRLARVFSPLLGLPFLPILFDWRSFEQNPMLLLTMAALLVLGMERAFRASFEAMGGGALLPRFTFFGASAWARWTPRLLVGCVTLGFISYFSYYTLLHHYRLQTHSWDLAIFDNLMWNLLRGEWFKASPVLGRDGSHIQYHATFGAYLLTPFYALRQEADTLLVLQAALTGGAIPAIYMVARRRLNSATLGVLFALSYALYAPQHGPIFYDFHFLTTAPFFVSWTIYFYETGKLRGLLVAGICALLWREDVAATLAAVAFFYLVSGRRPRWAIASGLVAVVYFGVVKFAIMPLHSSGQGESFTWIFKGLMPEGEQGFGAILKTVLLNPAFTLNNILERDKVIFVLQLLVPVVFLPIRHPRAWLLLVPGFLFTLLSTGYKPVYQMYFQYTANWTPFVFFGAAVVLGDWLRPGSQGVDPRQTARVRGCVAAMTLGGLLVSYHFGAVLQHHTFRGGFRKVSFEWTDKDAKTLADLRYVIDLIPKDASVVASETEAPHVASRENCFTMRFGHRDADYILVSMHAIHRKGRARDHFLEAINSGHYSFITHHGRFILWQRGGDHSKDAEGFRDARATMPKDYSTLTQTPPPNVAG